MHRLQIIIFLYLVKEKNEKQCTWIFRKVDDDAIETTISNNNIEESGKWECVGNNDNMPESSFSVFVGTKYMTTISYGRNNNVQSNSNSYLYTFVYNDEHPETSAWVVNTEQNIPIYRRTTCIMPCSSG